MSWYPSRLDAQNGNFIQRHAEAVAQYADVSVLYPQLVDDDELGVSVQRRKGVLEVLSFARRPRSLWNKRRAYINAAEAGMEPIESEYGPPDILHIHVFFPAATLLGRWKKRYGVPVVATEHSTIYLPNRRRDMVWRVRWLLKAAAKNTDVLCPVSKNLGDSIERYSKFARVEVVPNVVEISLFPERENRKDDLFRWIHVSTLSDKHKNVTGILEAFAKLVPSNPNIRLTLIGNGYHEKHRRTVSRLGIDEYVEVYEEMDIEEVGNQMAQHDGLVMFSNYENLPCVISEAKVTGLPVVATDVGGVNEMMDESDRLVSPKDIDQLVKSMREIGHAESSSCSDQIRSAAIERYSYEKVGQQYMKIYEELWDR